MSRAGAATKRDAAIIVWDVGVSSLRRVNDEQTFLDASKTCIRKLIGNKLLVQQKDLLGIIKFGTEETKHDYNEQGFDNIFLEYDLQTANFGMLENVENTRTTNIQGDFMGALCIALQTLKKSTFTLVKRNIVLLSPLLEDVNTDELQSIIEGLRKLGATLIIIGPDINLENVNQDNVVKEEDLPIAHALQKILSKVPSQVWTFQEALKNLSNGYTSRQVTPRPWKIDLEIGSRLKIRVTGYNEITSEEKPKFTTLTEPDMEKKVQREKAHFEKGNKRKFVDPEEIIQGHKFGTTIVPFAKEDKESLRYKSGEMCLRVLGFVHKSKISPAMYFNNNSQMFAPLQDDPVSRMAFSALVRAMNEQQLAALVRKVARFDGRLIFGVLLPQIRVDEGTRLMMIELPFADDARLYRFKHQDVTVTEKQLEAIDELIDNMDLTTALPNGEEAFASRETSDPTFVHFNEMLLHRAMHPKDPLPSPSVEVLSILEPPPSMKVAQEKLGPKLASAFNVASDRKRIGRPGTTRKPRTAASDLDALSLDGASQAENLPLTQPLVPADVAPVDQRIVSVGSVSPADDFQELLRQGRPLKDVCQQCLGVILQLATLATTNDGVVKPLTAVRVMRKACRNKDPALYNTLVREIRRTLEDRERTLLWEAIRAEELGLITRDENPLGGVSPEEALEFLNPTDALAGTMSMDMDDIE